MILNVSLKDMDIRPFHFQFHQLSRGAYIAHDCKHLAIGNVTKLLYEIKLREVYKFILDESK